MMKMISQSLLVAFALLGCAEGSQRPAQEITPRAVQDLGILSDVGTPGDAGSPDVQIRTDSETQPADRPIWVIVGDDAFEDGLRSRLNPPQTPELQSRRDVLGALPAATPIVNWTGPETPGDHLIRSRLESGQLSIPLLVLADESNSLEFAEEIRLELSYLEGSVFQRQSVLNEGGRPLLAIRWEPELDGVIAQVVMWASELDSQPEVVVLDAPVDGLSDEFELIRVPPCIREGLQQPLATDEHLCIAGPRLPTESDLFARILIEGRRVTDGSEGILIVDGIGRWVDDRQIDPVSLQDSLADSENDTRMIPSYGQRRLEAVQRLNAHAMGVSSLVEVALEPYLVAPGWRIAIDREDDGRLRFDGQLGDGGGLGIVLNSSPWLAAQNTAISYLRGHAGVYLRVSDSEGRLTGPPPSDEMHVCLPLTTGGSTRVEELEIARTEGTFEDRFLLTLVEFVSSDSEHCQ